MGEGEQEMNPYRLSQLMELAGKLSKTMVNSIWHLSFEEMEFVLDTMKYSVEKSKEEKHVSE